jgi:hypothetical protein
MDSDNIMRATMKCTAKFAKRRNGNSMEINISYSQKRYHYKEHTGAKAMHYERKCWCSGN